MKKLNKNNIVKCKKREMYWNYGLYTQIIIGKKPPGIYTQTKIYAMRGIMDY